MYTIVVSLSLVALIYIILLAWVRVQESCCHATMYTGKLLFLGAHAPEAYGNRPVCQSVSQSFFFIANRTFNSTSANFKNG